MNIRIAFAAAALSLASAAAFAAAPAAAPATTTASKPAATTPAPKRVKVKHVARHSLKCKAGEVAVKGKCEAKKAG